MDFIKLCYRLIPKIMFSKKFLRELFSVYHRRYLNIITKTHQDYRETPLDIQFLKDSYVGYRSMEEDVNRNVFFNSFIGTHIPRKSRVFEVGTGEKGTLTKMVLSSTPDTTVYAIEALEDSAKSANRRLRRRFGKRVTVKTALTGDPVPASWRHLRFNVFLCELFGNIVSCEGVVESLKCCGRAYPFLRSVNLCIPSICETVCVPVDISRAMSLDFFSVGEKVVFFDKFPFNVTQLSSSHAVAERYQLNDILKNPSAMTCREYTKTWKIAKNTKISGYAFYIRLTMQDGSSYSSCESDNCNWWNVFCPLKRGDFRSNHEIKLRTTFVFNADKKRPDYRIKTRMISTDGKHVYGNESFILRHEDLFAHISTFHKKHVRTKEKK
jgi:hypothetical protein